MKTRCVLIDDEFHAVANLERLIATWCGMLEVCGTAYTLEAAAVLIAEQQPDIIFLDIKMPGGNTIDRLNPAVFGKALVIFVTAYDEFALRAIKLGALDYLLKPVDHNELMQAVQKAVTHRMALAESGHTQYQESIRETLSHTGGQLERKTIGVYVNSEYCLLQYPDIIAFEAVGAYTKIHANGDRIYTVSKNIGHFEEMLSNEQFYRVHKSFIVNISGIATLDRGLRTLKMNNNLMVPVSVRVMPQFINRFNR